MTSDTRHYCAFRAGHEVARGRLFEVALRVRDLGSEVPSQIFDLGDGRLVDVLLEGTDESISQWIAEHHPHRVQGASQRSRGRPRLGVVGREITLLPRQWDWLNSQPGGASANLRRLVDEAAKRPAALRDAARDATFRFLNALAGDYPGFEESLRALYGGDREAFSAHAAAWPDDVRRQAAAFADAAWS
ncbi:MAG: DUF2239 family protein [Pseudomonadota bacterium]